MKIHLKKILAGIISTVMILSSFSAFAADEDVSVTDMYINIDTNTEPEIPDEEVSDNLNDNISDNSSTPEETAEPEAISEITDTSLLPDMTVWDIDTPLYLNNGISTAAELTADNACGDNLTWSFNSANSTLTISGTGDMWDFEVLFNSSGTTVTKNTVPWNSHRTSIKNVIVQEGVTSIGENAFANYYSGGVNSNIYRNITLPKSLKKIGPWAFSYAGLASITLPEGLEKIDLYAFQDCRNLTGIYIPNSVTYIDGAFYNCTNLKTITVDHVQGVPVSEPWSATKATVTYLREMNISSIPNQTYTGTSIMPKIVIKEERTDGTASRTLVEGTDYTVSYSNNINVGTATENISYIGDYSGYAGSVNSVSFNIVSTPISSATIGNISEQTYTGFSLTPNPTITYAGKTLVKDIDYTLSYSNNINVGTATVMITGKGSFSGTTTKTFSIIGIDISGAAVTFPEDITYQGEPCTPEPTVVLDGKTLVKGQDYTVSYSNNNGVGTGKAKITGIGKYIGSINVTFEIGPYKPPVYGDIPIDDDTLVEGTIQGTFVYDGNAKEPKPVLVYHFVNQTTGTAIDYNMVEGTDYEIVSYANNINAGTATITINGIGSFISTTTVNFRISPCELSATNIADIPSAEYCKKDICPEPEIKIGDKVMQKDVDYELSYENNHNRGIATVTITGKGNLSGIVTKNFEITPRNGSRFTYYIILP